jgi:hypothetical protein
MLYFYAVSGSVDVDFLALVREPRSALGVRVGAGLTVTGSAGGDGEDLYDINCLMRLTSAGIRGRIDIGAGLASRSNARYSITHSSTQALKFGFEGKLKIIGRWFDVFSKATVAKATGAQTKFLLGIGAFISWDVTPQWARRT